MLDQHLMVDKEVLVRVVNVADLNKEDVVLEIGGGTGNLTEYIRKIVTKVYVIDKDPKMVEKLGERFKNFDNVMVACGDASSMDFPDFTKCVSNLPYTICEPLLWKFTREEFKCLVFVVPKRFVDLLVGERPSRLKLVIHAFYNLDVFEEISPEAFEPQPKVKSCLIRLTPKNDGNFVLRELLGQYDKKTRNALKEILMKAGKTKQDALQEVTLRVRPKVQDKKICNLSLDEMMEVIEAFT